MVAFRASRYDKGEADYINCPMNREQYLAFRQALLEAEKAELKDFEQESANFFEGCLPIEELARRGEDTMRYGPLKPIGLWDPRWGDLYDRDVRRAAAYPCGGAAAPGGPGRAPVEPGGLPDQPQVG